MSKYPPKKEEQHIFKSQPKVVFSEYQKAIFKNIADPTAGNLIIQAKAGSGKTFVLVEGSKYIPKGKKSLFCAFNKSIQEELRSRLGSYVDCFTLHSLGFRAIKNRFGEVEVNNFKCWNIAEELIGNKKENYDLIDGVCKTVSLCKSTLTDLPAKIEELITFYDIDIGETEINQFVKYVIQVLRKCKEQTNIIDFDDMVWYGFIYRLNVGKYDYVFVDEAQDLNKAQIELAMSAVKPDGRIIVAMDKFQAIYGWRGADDQVLPNLQKRLNPKELDLPICYRCAKKIVKLAQTIVPEIQYHSDAIEGEIINIDLADLINYARPGSYVISRFNAPLIKNCLNFIKHSIPANMLGRDIGVGLMAVIKKSKKKKVIDLLKWLNEWEKTEKENLLAKYPRASIETITDKAECIRMLCEGETTIEGVKKNVDAMFKENDKNKIVLFASIHKIKGAEADVVFILADTLQYGSIAEENCNYVAYTRAKQKLYLVRKANKYSQYDDKKSKNFDRVIDEMGMDSGQQDFDEEE